MKKLTVLMLGLVASAASFASPSDSTPQATVAVASENKVVLTVAPEDVIAVVNLKNEMGRILYQEEADLQKGIRQNFDMSQLGEGTYQIEVWTGKTKSTKNILIQTKSAAKVVTVATALQSTSDDLQASLLATKANKVTLLMEPQAANASISLRDINGNWIFNESYNLKNGIRQNFDVSQLVDGTYQIEVSVGKTKTIKTFIVETKPAEKNIVVEA